MYKEEKRVSSAIHPGIAEFLEKCNFPYFVKGRSLYLHPGDLIIFVRTVFFLPEYEIRKLIQPNLAPRNRKGLFMGFSIFSQDDIQILLLAMKGGKSIRE